uniref:C2H2-type domain-containing protein n=1 Tax=Panagrolaimus sp. JU765 TaxID=591449 RepID=A0AC34R061_9BILA
MSNKIVPLPSTSTFRPDICPSRSSLDSGFESSKSKTSSGPSSPQSSGISISSTTCKTKLSPLVLQNYTVKNNENEKIDKFVENNISTKKFEKNETTQPENLATKLINSCTSPRSTANVRKLLLYCTPSTSAVPVHGKKSELKTFIAEKFGENLKEEILQEKAVPVHGKKSELKTFIAEKFGENLKEEILQEKGEFGDYECAWDSCDKKYEYENDVYDHVINEHVSNLYPKSPKENTNNESLVCQWDECEMTMTRGDPIKKYDWLVSHISKHLPTAQPHKCIFDGCQQRFKTSTQMASHVRNSHREGSEIPTKQRKIVEKALSKTDEAKVVEKKESAFGYFRGEKIPQNQIYDNIDGKTFDWLHELQIDATNMKNPCLDLIETEDCSKIKGSKRRKTHFKHFLSLNEKECEEESQPKNLNIPTLKLSTTQARCYFKQIFPNIKKPKCKLQIMNCDGKRQILRKPSKNTKPKNDLFKIIKNAQGKKIKIFDAKDHQKITDLTFDQTGKDLMDYWIKIDDEKYGKLS